jgi:outer membrane lipopolysaccharide assembly protein LptE/RlpB
MAVVVPEPTTYSLLALGLVTLLGGCRFHRRRS